jgi:hypothetical protein
LYPYLYEESRPAKHCLIILKKKREDTYGQD